MGFSGCLNDVNRIELFFMLSSEDFLGRSGIRGYFTGDTITNNWGYHGLIENGKFRSQMPIV